MTTLPRLADRITALASSMDLAGFAPFVSPVMFILNENCWPVMILTVSLVAIVLMALIIFGWRRDMLSPEEMA